MHRLSKGTGHAVLLKGDVLLVGKSLNLNLRKDGQHGGCDAEEQVDADEHLILSAPISVGVVNVEQDQRHQRQQVVQCGH